LAGIPEEHKTVTFGTGSVPSCWEQAPDQEEQSQEKIRSKAIWARHSLDGSCAFALDVVASKTSDLPIASEPLDRIATTVTVQFGERITVDHNANRSSSDPAELGGFRGICVEETESALSRQRRGRFASLSESDDRDIALSEYEAKILHHLHILHKFLRLW
jgi:hypothetical protein